MTRFAWPKLMRLGMVELGLSPEAFWSLTPAELFLLADLGGDGVALDRAGLVSLLGRYPDAPRARKKVE